MIEVLSRGSRVHLDSGGLSRSRVYNCRLVHAVQGVNYPQLDSVRSRIERRGGSGF